MTSHEGYVVRVECHTMQMANLIADVVRKELNGHIEVVRDAIHCEKCSPGDKRHIPSMRCGICGASATCFNCRDSAKRE